MYRFQGLVTEETAAFENMGLVILSMKYSGAFVRWPLVLMTCLDMDSSNESHCR